MPAEVCIRQKDGRLAYYRLPAILPDGTRVTAFNEWRSGPLRKGETVSEPIEVVLPIWIEDC